MRSIKETAASIAIKQGISYVRKDPDKRLMQLLELVEKVDKKGVNASTYAGLHKVLDDPQSNWSVFIKNLLFNIDADVLERITPALVNVALNSYDLRNESIEKYGCNIPWAILVDPTAACNLKCTGCWAAEYGKSATLDYDTLARIVREGKELGTFMYLFSGGEPLVCKKELIRLCEENPDCIFMAFTNGTLLDEALIEEIKRVGNFIPAFSIEGYEEATDLRRGEGTYKRVIAAIDLMRQNKLPFGYSACYHAKNTEEVGSDEFMDFLVEKGGIFVWYFTYMPVGADAAPELIADPQQRKFMYHQVRKARDTKPLFALDFWNDGEYVQGCIAGGRHYLHINSAGEVEPCAFIHYSDMNIKDHSLVDVLRSPLFMAYYKNQPFNDNMLRPCPLLDNPERLKEMVEETGAHSTEMLEPEDVSDLIAKTTPVSKEWAKVAQELWSDDTFLKHDTASVMYKTKDNVSVQSTK